MKRTERRGANHVLHLILSFLTCGLWAVTGWPIAAAMGRRTVTRVDDPEDFQGPWSVYNRGHWAGPSYMGGQPDEMIWNPYSERWVPRG